MIPQVIAAGFKRAGIYSFNPDIIDYGDCDDSANILSSDTFTIYSNLGNKNSPLTRTRVAISKKIWREIWSSSLSAVAND